MNKYPSPVIIVAWSVACITIGILFVPACEYLDRVFSPSEPGLADSRSVGPARTFEELLDAMEWEESKNGQFMYGDYKELPPEWKPKESYPLKEYGKGIVPIYCVWDEESSTAKYFEAQAVGPYQIHKIYVDDVNRILGTSEFTYRDRENKQTSRAMVSNYLFYYGMRICGIEDYKENCFEYMARIHNGGPNGWRKDCTKPYWEKVKARIGDQYAKELR